MSFPRYEAYKDSGVEWLGEIPARWHVNKFRHLFRESPEKIDAEIVGPMLSVSGYRGIEVKEYDDENRRRLDDESVGYRIVRIGQLVVNTMWLNYAGLGVSENDGHVSPAYRSYWIDPQLVGRFVHYLMRSSVYVMGYSQLLTGIRPNSLQMSRDDLMSFPITCPPRQEQLEIASFLDRETANIDALVEEQQRLIALLKEKRQAVISHAVTKGLDPNAPMKDSGVEWLGEVPAHWAVTKIARHLTIVSGFAFPSEKFSTKESDTRLLRGINVGVQEIRWNETVYWERIPNDGLDKFALSPGDLVIGMDRPLIGGGTRVAIIDEADTPCLLLQRVAALFPDDRLQRAFLYLLLQSKEFVDYFTPDMTGVSVPHISPEQIGGFVAALPPAEEQLHIADWLETQFRELDRLVVEAESAITLLQERRSALISAAVTGKIDVRGLVAVEAEAA